MSALDKLYDFLGGREFLSENFGFEEILADVSMDSKVVTLTFEILGGIRAVLFYFDYKEPQVYAKYGDEIIYVNRNVSFPHPQVMLYLIKRVLG